MERILLTFLIVSGVTVVLGAPVFMVAWRKRRTKTIRSFLISAGVVGILSGLTAGSSERQVAQCLEAGNSDCVDSGAAGLQLLMMVIYVVVAWYSAIVIYRE
ncbi:MAG TPA: hypothetical protein VGB33_07725 [Acidimicrobiia bacterium]